MKNSLFCIILYYFPSVIRVGWAAGCFVAALQYIKKKPYDE
jgi:hypothetical protein